MTDREDETLPPQHGLTAKDVQLDNTAGTDVEQAFAWQKAMRKLFGDTLDFRSHGKHLYALDGRTWSCEEARDVYEKNRIMSLSLLHDPLDMTDKLKPGDVALRLFHGRYTGNEALDDWGFAGPILGPVVSAHTTYGATLRVRTASMTPAKDDLWFDITETGLLKYKGPGGTTFFGDWSVYLYEGGAE